jgi:hypothetical protein
MGPGFPTAIIACLLISFFLIIPWVSVAQVPEDTEVIEAPYNGVEQDFEEEDEETVDFIRKSVYAPGQDSIAARQLPDSVLNVFKNDNAFWYANTDFKKPEQKNTGSSAFMRTLTWLLVIAGFTALVIWFLATSNVGVFRRSSSKKIMSGEEHVEDANIFTINYTAEIERATRSGNYRLAVRLHFLQLLKNLSERNIIQYRQEKTNFDYLLQMRKSSFYQDFFRITRNYEYTWYGKFDINADAFSTMKSDFETFNRRVG